MRARRIDDGPRRESRGKPSGVSGSHQARAGSATAGARPRKQPERAAFRNGASQLGDVRFPRVLVEDSQPQGRPLGPDGRTRRESAARISIFHDEIPACFADAREQPSPRTPTPARFVGKDARKEQQGGRCVTGRGALGSPASFRKRQERQADRQWDRRHAGHPRSAMASPSDLALPAQSKAARDRDSASISKSARFRKSTAVGTVSRGPGRWRAGRRRCEDDRASAHFHQLSGGRCPGLPGCRWGRPPRSATWSDPMNSSVPESGGQGSLALALARRRAVTGQASPGRQASSSSGDQASKGRPRRASNSAG